MALLDLLKHRKSIRDFLDRPVERKKIDILIALGYYDMEKTSSEHSREPIDKIASFNSY